MGTDIYFKLIKTEADERKTAYPKELKRVVEAAISSGGRPSECTKSSYAIAHWWNNQALSNWLFFHLTSESESNAFFSIAKSDLEALISDIDEVLSDPSNLEELFDLEECYDDLLGLKYLIKEILTVLDENLGYELFCYVSR